MSVLGELVGWIKSPRGTPTVRLRQKKGNLREWASCKEEKLEAAMSQTPKATREVAPKRTRGLRDGYCSLHR